MKIKIKNLLLLICFILFFCSCKKNIKQTKQNFNLFAFDTNVNISLYNINNDIDVSYVFDYLKEEIENFEFLFDRTNKNSELYKINHSKSNEYINLSVDCAYLFDISKNINKLSNYKYDISIGNLIDIWNLAKNKNEIPNENTIKNNLSNINDYNYDIFEQVDDEYKLTDFSDIYDKDNYIKNIDELKKENKKYYIKFYNTNKKNYDFGAIAKGYIADYIKYYLKNFNIKSAIINLGGNVLCLGKKDLFHDFSVGIKKPFDDKNIIGYKMINNLSFVTSGVYERYFEYNNKIYSHIIDNYTGYPINNDYYSATVLSKKSIIGDVLSTVCMLNGYDDSINIVESFEKVFNENIEVVFIDNQYNTKSIK